MNCSPYAFLYSCIFLLLWSVNSHGSPMAADTIIPSGKYAGYRIFATNITVEKRKTDWARLKMDVVNTGKFSISAHPKNPLNHLQVVFDYTLAKAELLPYSDQIREALSSADIQLEAGEMKKSLRLKINTLHEVLPVSSETITVSQSSTSQKKNGASNTPNSQQNRKTPSDNPDKEIVFETPEFNSQSLEEIMEAKMNCPDLVFDTISVVTGNSRSVVLSFRITNIGKGPAAIYEPGKKESEALGIRAFVSGATNISKGAIPVGGCFLETGLERSAGMLLPGESIQGTIEVDIRKKTKYLPIVILSLDAFLKLRECDRTNNTKPILLE